MTVMSAPQRTGLPVRSSFSGLDIDDFQALLKLGKPRPVICDCRDPLSAISAAFRSARRETSSSMIETLGSVLVLLDDSAQPMPRTRRPLISVSQAPLTALLLIETHDNDPISDDGFESIEQFRTQMMLALTQLGSYHFTAEQAARQGAMLGSSIQLLDDVLATHECDQYELAVFLQTMLPLINQNLAEVAG